MPTICSFNGVKIMMFLRGKEHNPPHIHAIMQDNDAIFNIKNGNLMAGEFSEKSRREVKEFIKVYRKELEEMWETEQYKKLAPLK